MEDWLNHWSRRGKNGFGGSSTVVTELTIAFPKKKKLWSTLCYLNIWYQIGHGQKKKINYCMLNRIFFDENQFSNCKSMKVAVLFWKVHKSYDCVAECMHLFLFSPKRDTRFFASSISSCCMYWEENVEKWSNTP